MKLIKCMHTQCECYNANNFVTPVGIVVHSTGANNTTVKRYSQPSTDDPNRAELLTLLGTNRYNNHWNKTGVKKAVHYFLGTLADGSIASVQNIPENMAAWGVGNGSKGSYNYSPVAHIQFEMCEDNLTNEDYFNKITKEAQELCADICIRHNWNSDVIVSHREAHKLGYASNHSDCDKWLTKFGKTMNWFREEVQKIIDASKNPSKPEEPEVKPVEPVTPYTPEVGEIVEYVGTVHYRSANATTAYSCKPGLATVSRIYNGKHPYHLINTNNDSAYVYGWVDAEFIRKIDKPVVEDVEEEKPEVVEPPVVEVEPPKQEPELPTEEPEVIPEPDVTEPEVEVEPTTPEIPENDPEDTIPEEPKVEPKPVEPKPTTKYGWFKKVLFWLVDFIKKIFKKK